MIDSCPSSDSLTIHVVVLFFTFALALWAFGNGPETNLAPRGQSTIRPVSLVSYL